MLSIFEMLTINCSTLLNNIKKAYHLLYNTIVMVKLWYKPQASINTFAPKQPCFLDTNVLMNANEPKRGKAQAFIFVS